MHKSVCCFGCMFPTQTAVVFFDRGFDRQELAYMNPCVASITHAKYTFFEGDTLTTWVVLGLHAPYNKGTFFGWRLYKANPEPKQGKGVPPGLPSKP